jgi:hypothetical protein
VLLQHGADPKLRGEGGRTALHVLFEKVHCNDMKSELRVGLAARALLAAGADPDARTEKGTRVVEAARYCPWAFALVEAAGASTAGVSVKPMYKPGLTSLFEGVEVESLSLTEETLCALAAGLPGPTRQEEALRHLRDAGVGCASGVLNQRSSAEYREAAKRRKSAPGFVQGSRWQAPTPSASAPSKPDICAMPALVPCLRAGKSCEYCFSDYLRSLPPLPKETTCPPGPRYVACGGVCCGAGYVCCVGATSANHGAETCRPQSQGCQSGWFAERIK